MNEKHEYVSVNIPILNEADQMEIVKTFNNEQLWYVGAVAKAFENLEQENEELKAELEYDNKDLIMQKIIKERDDYAYRIRCLEMIINQIKNLVIERRRRAKREDDDKMRFECKSFLYEITELEDRFDV